MTQKMIQDALTELKVASRIMGRAYLMSNSKKLKVAYTEEEKMWNSKEGYFVSKIMESGHFVEA